MIPYYEPITVKVKCGCTLDKDNFLTRVSLLMANGSELNASNIYWEESTVNEETGEHEGKISLYTRINEPINLRVIYRYSDKIIFSSNEIVVKMNSNPYITSKK